MTLNLPKSLSFEERLTLLKWRDPILFFKDTTGYEPFPYQKRVLKDITNLDLDKILICSAGNTGKTLLLANIALWSCTELSYIVLQKPYSVIIESGSLEQSKTLYDYLKVWLESNSILSKLVKGEPLKTNTEFTNRSFIKALPASWKSVFGQHCNLLIIDEAVEAGDELIEDSLRVIATSKPNRRILSSTPHNYNSLFVTMWEKKEQYKDWKRFSWSALDCPLYTKEAIEEAKKKGNMYFEIFYLGKPYPLKGTMIEPDSLKKCTRGNPIFQYNKDFGYVVMGIDWGWYPDPTAIVIIQRNEEEVRVLYYDQRKREDPEHLVERIVNLVKQYNVERIFSDSHNKHMNALVRKKGLPLYEVSFKGEKNLLQSNLTTLIEREILKIPEEYIPLIWQIRQYTYETKDNDDLVDALMLACKEYKTKSNSSFYFKVTKPKKNKKIF